MVKHLSIWLGIDTYLCVNGEAFKGAVCKLPDSFKQFNSEYAFVTDQEEYIRITGRNGHHDRVIAHGTATSPSSWLELKADKPTFLHS